LVAECRLNKEATTRQHWFWRTIRGEMKESTDARHHAPITHTMEGVVMVVMKKFTWRLTSDLEMEAMETIRMTIIAETEITGTLD